MQRNYVCGIRVVSAVSGIQTAKYLISEMYEVHLSYMSVYTISEKERPDQTTLDILEKKKNILFMPAFEPTCPAPSPACEIHICSPPLFMNNLPFCFGSVDSRHLHISRSFIDRLRFYHVGMSKQFARRLGTHFRYGLVWCVSIARNFRAQMRFI